MRALVTGIGGFVGGHLTTLLRQEGVGVWGVDRLPVPAEVASPMGLGVSQSSALRSARAFAWLVAQTFTAYSD